MKNCCSAERHYKKGFWSGLLYGLVPHTFCIAFIILSIIGATSAATLAKKFLLIPNFFLFLVIISFLFATASAFFYLKRAKCCSLSGIKNKWRYLSILYLTTISINALIIFVVFPASANFQPDQIVNQENISLKTDTVSVDIPCSGHASLIISEIKKAPGVTTVKFKLPRDFEITYDADKSSLEEIAALDIFKEFKLTLIN